MLILDRVVSQWRGVKLQVLQRGDCRNYVVNLHHPEGAKFCKNCNHYSLTDNSNNCECCTFHIGTKRKFAELKTFDKVMNLNYHSILEWMALPSEPDYNFGWPVRIGFINYFVPVRYFAEYLELPNLEGENIQKNFLENVKRESTVLGRYMHAIK